MDARSNDADVISLGRAASTPGNDQLDSAGQTILQLIHKAAGFAEENSRQAVEMAQAVSDKLRAAEERIAELEAEVDTYQERSDRAVQWLHRVYTEIEDRLLRQSDGRRGVPQRPTERKASIRVELTKIGRDCNAAGNTADLAPKRSKLAS